jgi:nucleotide-binding universal stress UspA family protein
MAIVLGYDDSPGAGTALAAAIGFAQRLGEPLVLVYGAGVPGGMGEEFRVHLEALHEMGRSALLHAVELAEAAGVTTEVELVDERPAEALLEVATRRDATMVVVGTTGESPLRGAMLGSTPHKLLHLSDRPVLCVPVRATPD